MTWARRNKVAAVASVHTRFETYLAYYRLQWLEPMVRAILRRLYHRCELVMAPAESTAAVLRAQRMNRDIAIWSRGIDRQQFNAARRDMDWRRSIGIADDELAIVFLGRIVMEKNLDVFADAIRAFAERGIPHKVMVIGEGPARSWFEQQLPDALFLGELTGDDLARALASGDVLLNPSTTEAFGNVTLEAMACALPVIAAIASGTTNLVRDGKTGTLVEASEIDAYADAIEVYARDPALRRRHGEAGLAFAKTNGIEGTDAAALAKLRALPADQVTGGLSMRTFMTTGAATYSGPITDGRLIVEPPGAAYKAGRGAKVALISGANSADLGFNQSPTLDALMVPFGGPQTTPTPQ